MESLLTLPVGDYRAVELILRFASALVLTAGLLLGLSTMCVAPRRRFPLILGAVALLVAAWFESGVAKAWKEAFELAGSSYCVTGLPLASEDRILAWAFGLPAILLCVGMSQPAVSSRQFRHLCWFVLMIAMLGSLFHTLFLIGFVLCVFQLRGTILPAPASPSPVLMANRIVLLGMAAGILLTEAGHLHLLPLGKTADTILVRGELIRSIGDILALALPGTALLVGILNLPEKERLEIPTGDDPAHPGIKMEDLQKTTVRGKETGRLRESRPRKGGSPTVDDSIEPRML